MFFSVCLHFQWVMGIVKKSNFYHSCWYSLYNAVMVDPFWFFLLLFRINIWFSHLEVGWQNDYCVTKYTHSIRGLRSLSINYSLGNENTCHSFSWYYFVIYISVINLFPHANANCGKKWRQVNGNRYFTLMHPLLKIEPRTHYCVVSRGKRFNHYTICENVIWRLKQEFNRQPEW